MCILLHELNRTSTAAALSAADLDALDWAVQESSTSNAMLCQVRQRRQRQLFVRSYPSYLAGGGSTDKFSCGTVQLLPGRLHQFAIEGEARTIHVLCLAGWRSAMQATGNHSCGYM